eukprot:40402-Eustigmatos_ZCMA.PRE.1
MQGEDLRPAEARLLPVLPAPLAAVKIVLKVRLQRQVLPHRMPVEVQFLPAVSAPPVHDSWPAADLRSHTPSLTQSPPLTALRLRPPP